MAKTGKPLRMHKDSVAAHQAECGCHPVSMACCERWSRPAVSMSVGKPTDASTETQGVVSSDGSFWHIDPLCKVRPEARQ